MHTPLPPPPPISLARRAQAPEKLDATNTYRCAHCKEWTQAEKELAVWTAPDTLVIQLKRFKASSRGGMGFFSAKIKTTVRFPIDLDMSPYVGEHVAALAAGEARPPLLYELVSVSNHSGTVSYGHYTAYARNFANGKWYSLNDSSAVEVAPSRVLESEGFVHIYRRKRVAADAEGGAEATTEEDAEDVVESL